MHMKTSLNFETDDTKELLAKLDFEFFLKQNILVEKYKEEDIDCIYDAYRRISADIKAKAKSNKRQFNYYAEMQSLCHYCISFDIGCSFVCSILHAYTLLKFQA